MAQVSFAQTRHRDCGRAKGIEHKSIVPDGGREGHDVLRQHLTPCYQGVEQSTGPLLDQPCAARRLCRSAQRTPQSSAPRCSSTLGVEKLSITTLDTAGSCPHRHSGNCLVVGKEAFRFKEGGRLLAVLANAANGRGAGLVQVFCLKRLSKPCPSADSK